jgi:hypothetical protein
MGLLDKLISGIGKVVGESAADGIKKALQGEIDDAKQAFNGTNEAGSTTASYNTTGDDNEGSEDGGLYNEDGRPAAEKIREVLEREFPEYQVRDNVSPETIGGTGRFMRYSFGVYKDNAPKLFIMLIGKTTCRLREYRWSKEQAEKAGVTLINFIVHEPNSVPYITQRLHKYL